MADNASSLQQSIDYLKRLQAASGINQSQGIAAFQTRLSALSNPTPQVLNDVSASQTADAAAFNTHFGTGTAAPATPAATLAANNTAPNSTAQTLLTGASSTLSDAGGSTLSNGTQLTAAETAENNAVNAFDNPSAATTAPAAGNPSNTSNTSGKLNAAGTSVTYGNDSSSSDSYSNMAPSNNIANSSGAPGVSSQGSSATINIPIATIANPTQARPAATAQSMGLNQSFIAQNRQKVGVLNLISGGARSSAPTTESTSLLR